MFRFNLLNRETIEQGLTDEILLKYYIVASVESNHTIEQISYTTKYLSYYPLSKDICFLLIKDLEIFRPSLKKWYQYAKRLGATEDELKNLREVIVKREEKCRFSSITKHFYQF